MKKVIFTIFVMMALLPYQLTANQLDSYLVFDASNSESYAEVGVLDQLNYSAFTVELWVNIQNFENDNYFVANEGWNNGEQGFVLRTSEAGDRRAPRFSIGTASGWEAIDGPNDLVLDTWTHLAAVVDGLELSLFVNGVLANSKTLAGLPNISQQVLIFGEGSMWTNRRMSGFLSDCRIWNVARTAQQIADNKDAYLTTADADLLANWKMDEGSGTTIADFADNFPGTLKSGVAWATSTRIGDKAESQTNAEVIFCSSSSELIIRNYEKEAAEFNVFNALGQVVYRGLIDPASQKSVTFNRFSAGFYVVVLDFGHKKFPVKFIKR